DTNEHEYTWLPPCFCPRRQELLSAKREEPVKKASNAPLSFVSIRVHSWFPHAIVFFSHCLRVVVVLSASAKDAEEKQTIEKTFVFGDSAGPRQIEVDNFEGSIQVTGYSGREVQLLVRETLEANSKER